ncbi:DUF3616 domain-containing protein [Gloeobacter morelensis]|uniref:DUF3616 domain-containing protein n=1 Tax=Gloeobacter morelensis MG652769 TaxID=2781736 RepID=A0ABY3PIN2_9CYAN|nr:DUF3616 domain-containing protein [Gloeobacter morelensis]UFP93473.1 DUF3616 domain-containing protein [Gloeobacter morelensis MG652769]
MRQIALQFDSNPKAVHEDLSAICQTPDGCLWVASDETLTLERLAPVDEGVYGAHRLFQLQDLFDIFSDPEGEIDIEGLDYAAPYLWVTGSHSIKRKSVKSKRSEAENLERLASYTAEISRYFLARVPLHQSGQCLEPTPEGAAHLPQTDVGNLLTEALRGDPHLGPFLLANIPGKDNGFDIEGLAFREKRLFLGLRGPVLCGWSLLLEWEPFEASPGRLGLKPVDPEGKPYRKHFLDLAGLGVRDLCFDGDDLLILAGPTMDLDGTIRLYRLTGGPSAKQTLIERKPGQLEALFEIPHTEGADRAEGITRIGSPEDGELLVVYDSPDQKRKPSEGVVLADVFSLAANG